MARKPFIAFVFVFAFAITDLHAQLDQVRFKRFDLEDGLSHPEISAVLKDSRGFLWIGSSVGLDRFDGYTVKPFVTDPGDTTSLPGGGVQKIFEAPDRLLVVLTLNGFSLYDPVTEKFGRDLRNFYKKYDTSENLIEIVPDPAGAYWFVEPSRLVRYDSKDGTRVVLRSNGGDSSSVVSSAITDFCIDVKGNHWVIHANGIAEKIDVVNRQGKVVERINALYNRSKPKEARYNIFSDADGDLWLCAPSEGAGAYFYSINEETLEHISTRPGLLQLNSNAVSSIIQDDNGFIWIGTDHGGINMVDKRKWKVRYILHQDGDQTSLASNSITQLYKDNQGIIWAGAYRRGLSYYHPNIYKFELYKHYSIDPTSLPFEDINVFEEDRKGNIWIGTNGGGLIYFDRDAGTFKQYKHDPGNANSLSGDVIVSLCRDTDDILWIGTYKAGLNKFDGKSFTRFVHNPADTNSLPSMNIWEIFEDSKKRLWIGTIDASAALLDKKAGKFHRLKTWVPNALQSVTIEEINEDRHGNIWFGTYAGIDVMSADGKTFRHYSPSGNGVFDLMRDSNGRMWVATTDGLNLFDESIDGFKTFREAGAKHAVLEVQEDRFGNIWMSTFNGLIKMTPIAGSLDSVSFKHYTESDGLHGRQFSVNAGLRTRKGALVFGGPTGFNISDGSAHKEDFVMNKIVFTELELYAKPVEIGQKVDGTVVLRESISEADEIVLPPNRDFFSLKFSALNFFNPNRDQYVYKLEGLNTGWLPLDARSHEIVFNSLNPGRYVLRVKGANSDGVWGENEAVLSILILPPFWKTKIAFLAYAIALIGLLVLARRIIQQREKLKYSIESERQEMQRVHALDMMKVKFFTNVSHEFRTPLTLILTPIGKLLQKTTDPELLVQFQLIHRNGRRLMNLVNQLLDFKKLEVNETQINPTGGDIVAFMKDTVSSFSDLSEKKNIRLLFNSDVDHLECLFDHDKLEKIMFNLLGNAFKFTLENGVVSVLLEKVIGDGQRFVNITVSDTGIGIPENKLDKIFEPFFQTDIPKNIVNQGSGIGLAITKEFIKIHGGRIEVQSEVGRGSSFKVILPLEEVSPNESLARKEEFIQYASAMPEATPEPVDMAQAPESANGSAKKKSLLLIDDNDDFRFYLRDNLKFFYNIHEARNGADGWNQALSVQPDLIVSDVMMPEMDGTELCTKIKSDERVSHIPVILLTARSGEDQRIEGLKTGADDYITKPFNFQILEARITNLLKQREKFQKRFRKTLDVKSSELEITPLDVKFIEHAVKIVEANISSSNFSVEDLAMELAISRAYVFKKILALTGKTPLEFIRTIRLQHAAQLLEKSQLSVREIAYKVGFNNPKYFTKYFKEQYNVLPSDYLSTKKNEE